LKPDRPDGQKETLGLVVIDEPIIDQTDPYILDMQIRQLSKKKPTKSINIRSIEDPHKNGKQIQKYVSQINELHKNSQAQTVS